MTITVDFPEDDNSHIDKAYENLTLEERALLHKLLKDEENLSENYSKLEKFVFKKKPPTPREFLDPKNGWLTPEIVESIYDYIKEDFIAILNEEKTYSQVVEYGATRIGKSFLARLLIMYTIVYIHYLREPNLYYGLSPTTSLAIYLLCFKFDKTKQLLLKPLFNFISKSPRFKQVKFQGSVKKIQEEVGIDTIVYSKSAEVGAITLASGLQLLLGNDDPMSIIGADVVQMYVSELAYFIENAGATESEIFRLYTDGLDRIKATVGNNYLAFMYLDTSANNAESVIENYILKELQNHPNVFFRSRSRWEARPHLYEQWLKTGETFTVITGNGSHPATIVTDQLQLKDVPESLIIKPPIDVLPEFKQNLIKSINNIAGRPSSSENKLIQDGNLILNIFNQDIPNIEGAIVADSSYNPDKYLWNLTYSNFFVKYDSTNFVIRRAPREPRFIGVDLAHSAKGDLVGISMVHKELSAETGNIMYITDFSFAVSPGENGINLEAVQNFIYCLAMIGNVHILNSKVDQFQSENMIQYLNRMGIPAERGSVDTSIEPYLFLFTCLLAETLKVGRNIFLKNNLDSLYRIKVNGKEKIDHSTDEEQVKQYFGDWENSKAGKYGKDVSDSLCQAVFEAKQNPTIPMTIYETETKRLNIRNYENPIFMENKKEEFRKKLRKL